MFDFFRNNMKFLMGLLMLLIIPSFVLFGIEGYSSFRESRDVVAKVGKIDITRQEWDATHRQEVDRLAASMPNIDRSLLDSEATRLATLERMVNERVLSLAAQDGLFLATDQRLARELAQDPSIASLRKPDGSLDVERYQQLLRAQGMTPEMFESGVRADLVRRQVAQGVAQTAFLPSAVADTALRAFFERREIQWTAFSPADYRAGIELSDDDVRQYYEQNSRLFQTTEQVDVEYLVLDLDAVARRIKPSEAEVRSYYDQKNAALGQQEQRRARHILLTVDRSASEADKAKVKAQAEEILALVQKSPDRFAELARTRSQDPGSASQGGDLDFFARGAMVKPFEDAVFSLDKGKVSGVVETEFGFHIIQVTDIRRPEPEPFDKARPQLEAELTRQQAQRQFAEAAEEFSNLVYERADSFAPAAERLGLTIQRANGVERTGGAVPLMGQPKVLAALFTQQALEGKRNSEALDLGGSQLVSVRVLEHRPAKVQPLEAVASTVRQQLVQERAAAKARSEAQAKMAEWQAAPASAGLRSAVTVSRIDARGVPVPVVNAAMSASVPSGAVGWALADLGPQGYAVVRVNKVLPRESVDEARVAQERGQLVQLWSQAESQAYLNALRARYKVQILAKNQTAAS